MRDEHRGRGKREEGSERTGADRIPGRSASDPLRPDPVVEAYKKDVDRTLLRENLKKTPQQRVDTLIALLDLAQEAHRAGAIARMRGK